MTVVWGKVTHSTIIAEMTVFQKHTPVKEDNIIIMDVTTWQDFVPNKSFVICEKVQMIAKRL